MKRKQIVVIGLTVVVMALLLSLKIKRLEKVEEDGHSTDTAASTASLTVGQVSETSKKQIDAKFVQIINDLEIKLQKSEGLERVETLKKIAQQWDDLGQPAPAAFYYEEIATNNNNFANWKKAGDLYTDAYQSIKDTVIMPSLVAKATSAYERALALKDDDLDVKTGLGIALVNGGVAPMAGITRLLEVVKIDPKNVKANMNLGLFSIKSGQFDKAIDRFKKVLDVQQTPDAWFYLATCYENTGEKKSAIEAYEQAKHIAADKQFADYIDKHIEELKK